MISGVKKPLIFFHISLAAGCKTMAILRRKFPDDSFCRIVARKNFKPKKGLLSVEGLKKLPTEEISKIIFLAGHMSFGIHTAFPTPCDYITMLRDPISRTISQYYYLTMNPTHEDHGFVKDMSLEEYAGSNMSGANNFQVRLLSAKHEFSSVDKFDLPKDALEIAKKNLKEHFKVVGVAEKFAETMLAAKSVFNWGNVYYGTRHIHPDDPRRPADNEIAPRVVRIIKENNQLDLDLYKYACELLSESIKKEYGGDFPKIFARFNRINNFLQFARAMEFLEDINSVKRRMLKLAKRFTNKFL